MKRNILKKVLLVAAAIGLSVSGCKKNQVTTATSDPADAVPVARPLTTFAGSSLVVPGDPHLTGAIEHLTKSEDYKVEVKLSTSSTWTTGFVYRTDNYATVHGSDKRPQTSASFINFSFVSGVTVNVRVTVINPSLSFTSAGDIKIRPLSYAISPASVDLPNKSFTFNLSSWKKTSIEIHDRLNPLFIFTDAPEVDPGAAGVTHYYAAGTTTNIGYHGVTLHSNDKVYIAGGAVVQGTFLYDVNASTVKFTGHGVLTSGDVDHLDNVPAHLFANATFAGTATSNASSNCSWDGLTIVNSAAFVFGAVCSFSNASHDNHWTDIKEVNWNANTDALWFDGHDCSASDLFFFCNDDVTTHGSTNFTLSNMVYWQGGNGGHLFMTDNYTSSDYITYDNIDVIGNDNVHQMISFHGSQGNSNIHCSNLTFKNIRVESTRNSVAGSYWENHFLDIVPQGNNQANNWAFTNIYVANQNTTSATSEGTIYGNYLGAPFDITTVHFTNFNMGANTPCYSQSAAHIATNGYATDVTFH